MSKDISLRTAFNRAARLYHVIRPRYPETLFEALVEVTQLQDDARLLEIGPGTGQATEPLAKRGYQITAIELGADLGEVARERLRPYPNVEVRTGAFEEVELAPEAFDLVYAATALHWIRPEVRFTRPHNLLKQRGHLAIIHTNHVAGEAGDEFFFASQPIYKKFQLDDKEAGFRLPRTADLKAAELDENLFELVFFAAFPLVVRYTAAEYAQLLSTFSPVISMHAEMRVGFLKEIVELIEEQFGGSILKHFAMTLTIAEKRSGDQGTSNQ